MKSPTIILKSHKDAIGLTANGVFASGLFDRFIKEVKGAEFNLSK